MVDDGNFTHEKWASDKGRRNYMYGQLTNFKQFVIDVKYRTKIALNDVIKDIKAYDHINDDKWQIIGIKDATDSFNIDNYMKHLESISRWSYKYTKDEVKAAVEHTRLMLLYTLRVNNIRHKNVKGNIGNNWNGYFCNWEIV